jgi:hypothetical protein
MIITTVLQVLLERFDLGKSLPEAIATPRASQRNGTTTSAEQAFQTSPEGVALDTTYGHDYVTSAEIGAVTGIEFLDRGQFLAAAEPTRRGGGSAMVVGGRGHGGGHDDDDDDRGHGRGDDDDDDRGRGRGRDDDDDDRGRGRGRGRDDDD